MIKYEVTNPTVFVFSIASIIFAGYAFGWKGAVMTFLMIGVTTGKYSR
jgi:glucose-6-phosphate-specific signal transduction histidine kinase